MLFRARRLGLPKAPFSLGRLGAPINAVALCYNIVISFFLFFPNYLPVTGLNMSEFWARFDILLVLGAHSSPRLADYASASELLVRLRCLIIR